MMRALWAKRLAFITGSVVVLLAILFAVSQNPQQQTTPLTADYVGSSVCARCHIKEYRVWSQSGHAFALNAIQQDKPPSYPFSVVPQPPSGYSWQDIRHVVGGYQWKANFIDQRGNLITGAASQYNFANTASNKKASWVANDVNNKDQPFDCGKCHTTGYHSNKTFDTIPGIRGTYAEPGIGCENCHGPGRQHVNTPTTAMRSDNRSEFCGGCHSRDNLDEIRMAEDFLQHQQQFNAQRQSKHANLTCVQCHDPHKGVVAERTANRTSTRIECRTCHSKIADAAKNNTVHRGLHCIDCHMPRLDASAWSDTTHYSADMRTHLFTIKPQAVSQADNKEGKNLSIAGITLEFACRSCHRDNGQAMNLTLEKLRTFATGIHSIP